MSKNVVWSFSAFKAVLGLDISDLPKILDQEKSINNPYRRAIQEAQIFLEPLYIQMNLSPNLV